MNFGTLRYIYIIHFKHFRLRAFPKDVYLHGEVADAGHAAHGCGAQSPELEAGGVHGGEHRGQAVAGDGGRWISTLISFFFIFATVDSMYRVFQK